MFSVCVVGDFAAPSKLRKAQSSIQPFDKVKSLSIRRTDHLTDSVQAVWIPRCVDKWTR